MRTRGVHLCQTGELVWSARSTEVLVGGGDGLLANTDDQAVSPADRDGAGARSSAMDVSEGCRAGRLRPLKLSQMVGDGGRTALYCCCRVRESERDVVVRRRWKAR